MATVFTDERLAPAVSAFVSSGPKELLVGGEWVESASGKTFPTVDPATGETICEVYEAGAEDVDRAVRAARTALEGAWGSMTPAARGRCLLTLADLIEEHGEELAQLETLDNGKPLTESQYVDVPLVSEIYRYYGGATTKIHGNTLPVSPSVGRYFAYTLRQPVGVVGAIVPWNFPMLITSWKLGPALACGNTVVLKPAEETPLTALRFGELVEEAGFPEGVVNVVCGDGPGTGAPLAEHLGVDKISFTGSFETGRKIVEASKGNLKRLTLELGGKSPNIVFADSDLDAAVQGALLGIFLNQGEVCCAGSRLYIEASVYDDVLGRVVERAGEIALGHGLDDDTEMGPLVSEEQLARVLGYVETGVDEGATIVAGGRRPDDERLRGYFLQPTVFADVRDDMRIATEEIFGPVLSVMPFDNEESLVGRANSTLYGLAAGIWTENLKRAHRLAEALKAGTVWINGYNMVDPSAPFGGFKMSGYGRELGMDAIHDYTQVKSVWVNLD